MRSEPSTNTSSSESGSIAETDSSSQPAASRSDSRVQSNLFSGCIRSAETSSSRRRLHELIHDDTDQIFCVIDNSGSMKNLDGKIFEMTASGRLRKAGHGSITRWEEARHKCLQVAEYNFKRGVPTAYYLLNPSTAGTWQLGVDYVVIGDDEANPQSAGDASEESVRQPDYDTEKLKAALASLEKILITTNVRGNTPLDQITRHLRQQISTQRGGAMRKYGYVVFTDGEPNSKLQFERELRQMASDVRVADGNGPNLQSLFLTINLCTDKDDVVAYYNELDEKLGTELSGMDVLDDLEAEQQEVRSAGNSFITYCQELHICRMSGCHSVLADLLDEQSLSLFHSVKLVKELLKLENVSVLAVPSTGSLLRGSGSYDALLWLEDTDEYVALVDKHNYDVFDMYTRRSRPFVDVRKLKNKIWWYKLWNEPRSSFQFYGRFREWYVDSGYDIFVDYVKWPLLFLLFLFLVQLYSWWGIGSLPLKHREL